MSTIGTTNVFPVYESNGMSASVLTGVAGSTSDHAHRPGVPGVLSRFYGNSGFVKIDVHRAASSESLNAKRMQDNAETSSNMDVSTCASPSVAFRKCSAVESPLEPASPGLSPTNRPMGPQVTEGGPPAGAYQIPCSVTSPPVCLPDRIQQQPQSRQLQQQQHWRQQHQQQQQPVMPARRENEQLLPDQHLARRADQAANRHHHLHVHHFEDRHPRSTGRQQQRRQQPFMQQQQPLSPQPQQPQPQHVPGQILSEIQGGPKHGMANDGVAAACNAMMTWDASSPAQCDSMVSYPQSWPSGHPLFTLAAAATVEEASTVASPMPPETLRGDSSGLEAPLLTATLRNNSQVLLPPLLMRTAVQDGNGERGGGTVFFGPGALPGLLVGSSPQEICHPADDGGGTRLLGGPTFLHVAPTIRSRQQVNGMVPTAVSCLPGNDEDESAMLWAGFSGVDADADHPKLPMPSGAAALALCRDLGMAGKVGAVVAAAAAAGLSPDLEGPCPAAGGASWLIWTSRASKAEGLDDSMRAPGHVPSPVPVMGNLLVKAQSRGAAAVASAGAAGGIAATAVAVAAVATAATANGKAAAAAQLQDHPPETSSVSLAQLRPFNTSAMLPLELETATVAKLAEPHASSGNATNGDGGNGGRIILGGSTSGSGELHESATGGDSELAAVANGWLMPYDGDGGATSRRCCRGNLGSTHSSRAVAAGSWSTLSKERGSSNRTSAAAAAATGDGVLVGFQTHVDGGGGGTAATAKTAGDLCGKGVAASAVNGVSKGDGQGSVTGYCGDSESGRGVAEAPLVRWQRAARAAGLTASIARAFRTLRNQHDENLVREDQLQVVGEIGTGSFARVDKCLYTPLYGGKPFLVAVKRIKPEMLLTSRDPEDLQLFIQEAQLLRKLNHPHIVQYIGLGIVLGDALPGSGVGGCSGGGGGVEEPPLGAEQLLELSRRSWGSPSGRRRRRRHSIGAAPRKRLDRRHSMKRAPLGGGRGRQGVGVSEKLYDSDDDDGRPSPPAPLLRGVFIVEEFLSGGTLKTAVYQQMLRPQKQLYSNATALRWMAQVAGALSYMHTCRPKVLHRDIKLDNVLLQPAAKGKDSSDGLYGGCIAKLGDLGLAALLAHHRHVSCLGASDLEEESVEPPQPQSTSNRRLRSQASVAVRQRVTAATQAPPHLRQADDATRLSKMLESHKRDRLGTYMYMAPEVYQRQKYDEKCDCFSFAILLYEVFHRYITACSLEHTAHMEKYARQVSQGFRPAIHEDIPTPLRRVIKQCWAQNPEQRPDMAVVARELWAMEARGVMAALDRKQQAAAADACCCTIS